MYKKILAAVNEHLNAEVTARYALHLARDLNAKLYFCFVVGKDISRHDRRAAEDAMDRLFSEALDLYVQTERIVATGSPLDEIGQIVRHENIGIVFAAARREDVEKRFYAGTVARSLLLKLTCSVALVRVVHSGRVHPRKILVPVKARIDRVTERAFFTTHMAKAFGSKVFVFHMPKPVAEFFHGEIHLTPDEWESRISPDMSHFLNYLNQHQIEHEGRLLPGRTARSITIEAFAKRHDLIIMGASERGLLASLLKGNPVEDVLRETPCDLIILKPRRED